MSKFDFIQAAKAIKARRGADYYKETLGTRLTRFFVLVVSLLIFWSLLSTYPLPLWGRVLEYAAYGVAFVYFSKKILQKK